MERRKNKDQEDLRLTQAVYFNLTIWYLSALYQRRYIEPTTSKLPRINMVMN